MKKVLLIAAVLLLLPLSMTIRAQVTTYGIGGAGCQWADDDNVGKFGMFLGSETPIYNDTAKGFSVGTRLQYYFINRHDNQAQGLAIWTIQRKTVGPFSVAFGEGVTLRLRDGSDEALMGAKLELGYNFYGGLNISAGCDLMLVQGERNQKFVYGGIGFTP